MVSVPLVGARDSTIVVRRTFIEEVDAPGTRAFRQRSCSDPGLFQIDDRQHGQLAEGRPACAPADVEGEVVEFLCGLSEAGTIETNPDQLGDDAGGGASLPCYAHLREAAAAPEPGAPGSVSPAGDLDRLLRENQRLALENHMLRENKMLGESQDHLVQQSQLLGDRLAPCLAARSGAGAPIMAVAPGAWVVPVGVVAMPVDACAACAAQPAGVPLDVAPRAARRGKRGGAAQQAPAQRAGTRAALPVTPEHARTTVMMRNLPNNYSRKMLVELLDKEGFAGKFDFLYLPMDFKSSASLGYAFINLVDPSVVPAFWSKFDGFSDWILPSKKVCSVSWTDPHQGLNAHIERYRNSPVMHSTVLDAFKPAIFKGGVMVPFPEPTKATHAPRVRNKPLGDTEAPHCQPA